MPDPLDDLAEAVRLMRAHAVNAAPDDERRMVDQSPDSGLIVGAYMPADVDDTGTVSTSCVAFFAYPGDDQTRTYHNALPVASHMAGLDPAVAQALAAWLEAHWLDLRDSRDIQACDSPHNTERAIALARTYLRREVY